MREIKFRAWDKEHNEMCDVIDFHCMNYPDRYDVMQFTGLHDKNGVDVYDGDIVQIIHPAWRENATVEFSDGSFIFKQIRGERSCIPGWTFMREIWEVEVIGNIYENPELL